MSFPTFNLSLFISEQNQKSTEFYLNSETFGFAFFQAQSLGFIKNIETLFANRDDVDLISKEDRETFRASKEKSIDEIKYFLLLESEKKYFNSLREFLNQESFWKDKKHLHSLKKLWFEQSEFCQVSNEGLYILSQRLIALENHLHLAQKMLPHSSVPEIIRQSYARYLEAYLQECTRLKKSLANSMQFRILCFFEDRETLPIHHFYERVQGYINKPVRIVRNNILTEKDYVNFEGFLKSYAPEKLSTHKISLPNKLQNLIPNKMPRFSRLFKGTKYRHDFLKDKLYLLLQITKNQDKHHYYFHWHAFPQGLATFSEMSKTLNLCQKYTIQKPSWQQSLRWNVFRRKSQRFNNAWNDYLLVEKQNCLNSMLSFLKACVIGLEKESESWLSVDNVSWDKVSKMRELFSIYHNNIKILPPEPRHSFLKRWQLLQQRFQYCDARLQLLNKTLVDLSKGIFIHENEIKVFAQLLVQMQIEKPEAFKIFLQKHHDLWESFIKRIKTWINSKKFFSETFLSLLSLVNIIKPDLIEKLCQKAFYRYLFQIISLDNYLEKIPEEIIKLEKLLLEYAKDVRVGTKTIAQHIDFIHQNNPDKILILFKISVQSLYDFLENNYQKHRLEKDMKKYDDYLFSQLSKTKYADNDIKLALWKKVYQVFLQGKSLMQSLQALSVAEKLYLGLHQEKNQNELESIETLFHKNKKAHDLFNHKNDKSQMKSTLKDLVNITKNIQTSKRFGLFAKPLVLLFEDDIKTKTDTTTEVLTPA